jgi:hypothetical protein
MSVSPDYESRLIEDIADFYLDPLGFVLYVFDWGSGDLKDHDGPDEWQAEQLKEIGDLLTENPDRSIQEAIASGHGIGKSAETAWLILWAMSTRPNLNGIITANTTNQLTTKTWRELAVWHKRAINKHWFKWTATKFFHVAHPETWFTAAVPNTEHNSEAFAGQHAEHVLVIYDEASAIPDKIWEVSEGAMTTAGAMWFVFGNPTRNTGRFRECFGRLKHRWITRQIDSRKARMTDKAKIQQWIEDYGEDSDFVRIRVLGEFPRAADNQFIPSDIVDNARARTIGPEIWGAYPRFLSVDVARFGADQSVILRRQGPKVWMPKTFRELDTMTLAGHVMDEYRNWHPSVIFVDGVGIGAGVVDRLKQENLPVVDVQSGAQARDTRLYANLRAEMWANMRDWLKGEIDLPDCRGLLDGLMQPEYGFNSRMQIQLESKDDMKARGLSSPDEADALAFTFAPHPLHANRPVRRDIRPARSAGWT